MKKCLFIYNPVSGKSKKILKNLDYIKKRLEKRFDFVEIIKTEYPKHATLIASEKARFFDLIVCAGGDGTFNEVVQGIASKRQRPAISYIPAGTICDMAKNLSIPMSLKKALDITTAGVIKKGDICKINDNYFCYASAFGTYVEITFEANQTAKRKMGRIAYYFTLIKHTFRVKKMKLEITSNDESQKFDSILLLMANAKRIGGFTINRQGTISDGMIDLIIIKKGKIISPSTIWNLFLKGTKGIKNKKYATLIKVKEAKIEVNKDVVLNVDGEKSEKNKVFNIKVLNKHIDYVVDESKARFLG